MGKRDNQGSAWRSKDLDNPHYRVELSIKAHGYYPNLCFFVFLENSEPSKCNLMLSTV